MAPFALRLDFATPSKLKIAYTMLYTNCVLVLMRAKKLQLNYIIKGKASLSSQGKIGIINCMATPKTMKYVYVMLKPMTRIIKMILPKSISLLSFNKPLIQVIVIATGAILITPKIKVNQATTIIFAILTSN